MRLTIWMSLFSVGLLVWSGCSGRSPNGNGDKPSFALVTNGVADFWKPAQAGAAKAGEEFGAEVLVIMPSSMSDQTRKLEDLLTRGTDGIAISPINPENQTDILNQVAANSLLITHDSDAPQSKRLVYIGMDNYRAGQMCGQLVRQALPNGGKVMLLLGRLDQDNSKRRRQGCIDAILGRPADPTRNDPPGQELTSADGNFTVLGTLTDQFDRAKAKANAEDTLTRHPDIGAMVGLFEYNPPLILEALDRAGRLNQVEVIGFDENPMTLQGVIDGTVVGTIVQSPYQYGYQSIRILNALHQKHLDVLPESGFIDIPARVIDKSNVESFWNELKLQLEGR